MTTLEAAQALGITVMCSASVLQGQLTRNLPSIINDTFQSLETDGQSAAVRALDSGRYDGTRGNETACPRRRESQNRSGFPRAVGTVFQAVPKPESNLNFR